MIRHSKRRRKGGREEGRKGGREEGRREGEGVEGSGKDCGAACHLVDWLFQVICRVCAGEGWFHRSL